MRRTMTAAAVGALVLGAAACGGAAERPAAPERAAGLRSFASCDAMLAFLRARTAQAAGPWGFRGAGPPVLPATGPAEGAPDTAARAAEPETSTTNVQEAGVDEPDIVKAEGRRMFTLT
ncbi:MAG: beta-propeller domain-containing protein, partial [Thermoleophilia bacterium]|nr:beta-propeller domain-containing protein [Thermoleophilia bacterium]